MKRNGNFIFLLGCLLICCSLALLLTLQIQRRQANHKLVGIVHAMETILTDRREGTIDIEHAKNMPALEFEEDDFVALLEIPFYGLKLPVCNTWDKGKVLFYPCRFHGSAYNGSLIIGGYDQPGYFDFFDRVSNGTVVTITDMTGSIFSYTVDRIERSSSAGTEVLISEDADLTLFVRDAQSLDYILLRCVIE